MGYLVARFLAHFGLLIKMDGLPRCLPGYAALENVAKSFQMALFEAYLFHAGWGNVSHNQKKVIDGLIGSLTKEISLKNPVVWLLKVRTLIL